MTSQLIASVSVKNLFGLYTYHLPDSGSFEGAGILYGENGLGKSTILRLAFHLLSSASDRGHRTQLYNTKFEEFEVRLSGGILLRAAKEPEEGKPMLLTVQKGRRVKATWNYLPTSLRKQHQTHEYYKYLLEDKLLNLGLGRSVTPSGPPEGEEAYLQELKRFTPLAFILNADRRLDSDSVPDSADEVEFRRMMRVGESKRFYDLVARSREIALSQALASADRWLNQRVFRGAQQGSTNVHTVYVNVLKHLAGRKATKTSDNLVDTDALVARLRTIEDRSVAYARYGLSAPISMAEFFAALKTRSQTKRATVGELLVPYVESLEKRLEALEPAYTIVDRFVSTINEFLQDKQMRYNAGVGFTISNRLGVQLAPRQLSSGEQQLLLLFFYVLIARDTPSVFMIDEPEISLNVKWQRKLVRSLLGLTDRKSTQFLFATHSMELLAQHRDKVVRLVTIGSE